MEIIVNPRHAATGNGEISVAALLKLIDIDEAITNLEYKNKDTFKYKLIHIIRLRYENDESTESMRHIDTEELVKALWSVGDKHESVKSKKKNLSSIKSHINADLKRLYQEGKNPQGVIIGQNNLFDMSDEAKDKALETIAEVLKERRAVSIEKISEVLKAVNDIMSESSSFFTVHGDSEAIHSMKSVIHDLSRKIGLSLPGDSGQKHGGVSPSAMSGNSTCEAGAMDADESMGGSLMGTTAKGGPDIPENIDKRARGPIFLDGISEKCEESSADEIGDQRTTDHAGVTIHRIAGEGSTEKNGRCTERAAGIEGQSGRGEREYGANGEIQGCRQENEMLIEADPVEIIEEDDVISDIVEVVSDQVLEGEAVADEVLEEIAAEAEIAEVEAEAAMPAEGVLDKVLKEEPVAEEEREEIAAEAAMPAGGVLDEVLEEESVVEEEREEIAAEEEIAEIEADGGLQGEGSGVENILKDDLCEKAEILTKLAEAAKFLERLGPEFDHTVFNNQEIKEKAKFLSEEFERDLGIREKYFNQHILIIGGEYIIGGGNSGKCELPNLKAYVSEFYIGKFPVTNALFDIFVEKTGYVTTAERRGYGYVYIPRAQRRKDSATGMETFHWSINLQYKKIQGACWHRPSGPGSSLYNKRRHPVVQVTMEDARAFAAWTGKRIPTEKEWEAAARTSRGFIYPWGNHWRDNACNIEKSYCGDTTAVDQYVEFANGAGVVDLLGNVLEWTLDVWRPDPVAEENRGMYVVKGGSWISDSSLTLSRRFPMEKNATSNILGFRCVAI
jgi:formylglycine-generating enzyme required for sulfatase activity